MEIRKGAARLWLFPHDEYDDGPVGAPQALKAETRSPFSTSAWNQLALQSQQTFSVGLHCLGLHPGVLGTALNQDNRP
jgi:hypothetical protein